MPLLIFLLLSINVSFAQQNGASSIPTSVEVKNTYTLEPLKGVTLIIQVKEYNGKYYKVGTYQSNEEGLISLSLFSNKVYTVTAKKENFYSQISIVSTNDFSRTGRNKFNVSMRPRDCYRLKGIIENNSDTTISGYLTLLNMDNQTEKKVNIKPGGSYFACGKCGESYEISPFINGQEQQKDTITLFDKDCKTKRNPLMKLNLNYERSKPEVPVGIYAKGDSLILEALVFGKKSSTLKDTSGLGLEKLASTLMDNPKLIVELHIHTDSRKSDRYNWLLSEKRGLLIEEYLNKKGIAKEQFSIIPIGEGQPINRCKNRVSCSNAEHAVNNRVEMHILQGDKDFLK